MDEQRLDIIIKFLSDDATLEEKENLSLWIGQDKENAKLFAQVETIWNALDIKRSGKNFNSVEAFERFREIVQKESESKTKIIRLKGVYKFLRIAAVIILICGISFLFLIREKQQVVVEESLSELIVPRGSKAEVELPDGTKVWLNSDSKISYGKDYNIKTRDVYLQGEGYFEVVKNPDMPFVVNTSDIKVKALGTTFNVKSYPEENTIEATLVEGKVVLERKASGRFDKRLVTLKPNQKVTYFKDTNEIHRDSSESKGETGRICINVKKRTSDIVVSEKVNTELLTAWTENSIGFEDESFESIALKLERRFGVSVHFGDNELRDIHFSGKFNDIIIEQILKDMQIASHFSFCIKDKDVYISKDDKVPGSTDLK